MDILKEAICVMSALQKRFYFSERGAKWKFLFYLTKSKIGIYSYLV